GVTGWRWWRHGSGLWWRVVARELVGRIDPEMRIILGVDRKIPPEKFSGGGWPEKWAAGGGESSPEIMGREREFMRCVCVDRDGNE
ncbi:hypothetical protein Tco_1518404, partial [Tanacetum coccineum]